MTAPRLTFASVKAELRDLGVTIRRTGLGGEFRVNFLGGTEGTAHYTDDLADARDTGDHMALHRARHEGAVA